jgi:hypothetical protein
VAQQKNNLGLAVVSTKLEEPDAACYIVRKYVAEVIKALE